MTLAIVVFSAIAAICNLINLVLLIAWYWVKKGKR